jgi:hypothetical protein
MADLMLEELPRGFPRIAEPSRRQMKDVELAAQLLLLVENGPESFSQDDLDTAYASRDEVWDEEKAVQRRFREVLGYLKNLTATEGSQVAGSRLRNQADFYSLFGAVSALKASELPEPQRTTERLAEFISRVDDPDRWAGDPRAAEYYDAARSASNDLSRRKFRVDAIQAVLKGAT